MTLIRFPDDPSKSVLNQVLNQSNLNESDPFLSLDLVHASAMVFFIVSSPSSYIFFIMFMIEALGSATSSFFSLSPNLSSLKLSCVHVPLLFLVRVIDKRLVF